MPEALILPGMADAEPDLSTFENKTGLAEDMKFLASMPELCDVTFLVGDTREPVCAVKVCAPCTPHFFFIVYHPLGPEIRSLRNRRSGRLNN